MLVLAKDVSNYSSNPYLVSKLGEVLFVVNLQRQGDGPNVQALVPALLEALLLALSQCDSFTHLAVMFMEDEREVTGIQEDLYNKKCMSLFLLDLKCQEQGEHVCSATCTRATCTCITGKTCPAIRHLALLRNHDYRGAAGGRKGERCFPSLRTAELDIIPSYPHSTQPPFHSGVSKFLQVKLKVGVMIGSPG